MAGPHTHIGPPTHTCHAIGCRVPIAPEFFMCRPHWWMVPRELRDRVWKTYRVGQCEDWQPSTEYCDAAQAAVLAVAEKEGFAGDPREREEYKLYDVLRPVELPSRTARRTD
jgi:hypothetical protein